MLVAGALACSAPRTSVNAPVELVIPPIGSTSAKMAANGDRGSASGRCSVGLVLASRIEKSAPGCYLDEHVSEGTGGGRLVYPCSGDGPAEASFGPQRYAGRMDHGELELSVSTELDWEDGCRWGTDALIKGSVMNGSYGPPSHEKLVWTYRDRIVRGSACSGICTAKTSISVIASDAPRRPSLRDDGDDVGD